MEEKWQVEKNQRLEKEAELEKRTLALQEQFESGNLTEEQYLAAVKQETDYAEPQATWVPIEENEVD